MSIAKLSDLEERRKIARDTIERTPDILQSYPLKTLESYFIDQLLPLEPSPHREKEPREVVEIVNNDALAVARLILESHEHAKGRIAVLSLASDQRPAGGWQTALTTTQEESLCYSSTLFHTLHKHFYPWPNTGPGSAAAVFSPQVVVFKASLDEGCVPLPKDNQFIVSVISASAPRNPALVEREDGETTYKESGVLDDLQAKIRLIYRLAARENKNYLILGAFGAGVYGNPPKLVAETMRDILLENEFKGYFEKVAFAIKTSKSEEEGNFAVFRRAFDGAKV